MNSKNALPAGFYFTLKNLLPIVFFFLSFQGFSQTLSQQNFSGIIVPQYMAATGTNTRLPIIFRAKVSGLSANSTYKYYIQGTTASDLGTSNSGSGMSVLINTSTNNYTITSSPGLSTAGTYETFTTDANGTFTGWFGMMNTTGTRFTAGYDIFPTLTLNNGNGGTTPALRFALDMSVKVIALGPTTTSNYGTGIYSVSQASAKNIIALYDNVSGNGRPLAITYAEDESITAVSTPTFYTNNVNGKTGAWGALIPNVNSNGVRKIEQFSVSTGSSVGSSTDADGVWTSINTVNPSGGTTALQISGTDAPLTGNSGNGTSGLSDISASNSFVYPENIDYINYQEAQNIDISNTSIAVASFDLRDGGGTNDADNLATTLSSLTFTVTNPGFIRRAAIFNGSTKLAETTINGSVLNFTGFTLTAADNNSQNITLRVSYTTNVTDNAQNIYTITSATASASGSGFASANAGGSASSVSGDNNRIEVTATKLAFTTQAAATATIYKTLSTAPVVSAQDESGNTDFDFSSAITIENNANISQTGNIATAVNGSASFPLLMFQQTGTTTITAASDALTGAKAYQNITIADAKKWDGGAGTNLWSDANNWYDNSIPSVTDVVVLDNSFTSGSYSIILPNTAVTVNYLKISPAANNTITLTLPATNIACPGLTVGDNTAGTQDFVLDKGGIFINAAGCSTTQGFTINSQGVGGNGSIVINAGGKYIHRNSKAHTELFDITNFDKNSDVIFDVNASTSYVISISGRQLGNVTLSAASKGATQAYSANYASAATIKGNFTIETKATLALSGNGNLFIGGNISNAGTFTTGNTSTRKLVLNGTTAQAFSGAGTYNIKTLEIDNAAGATLNTPISLVNYTGSGLILTNGKIYTSATNMLTLPELSTISGGSKNSFISGPVTKIFNANSQADINLAIGKDTLYRAVTIAPESIATASTFKAEYFNTASANDVAKQDGNFGKISGNEYWNLQRISGNTNAAIGFNWGESSQVSSVENVRIARWDGSQWISEKQDTAIGTGNYGTVSTKYIADFGTFTLGSQYIVPLPVSWLFFTAKNTKNATELNWATASEINNDGFEIQRSLDGENFTTIGFVNGNGTTQRKHFYSYADMENVQAEVVYYRLKQTDFNGTFEYSTIEAIRKKTNAFSDVSIYADAQKYLHIEMNTNVSASAQIEILNMNGQVLQSEILVTNAGNNVLTMNAQANKAGIYILRISQNGTLQTRKFVLQ